ncbi:YecA family protein [Sutcliffiella horikoshii]|uniref:YecA family protein n=1 Tax=Sutcliffiella horikoshii TaxID=79883 RepID=UPI00384B0896
MTELKIGRNDSCPCKSGKKYKKCHGSMQEKNDSSTGNLTVQSIIEREVKAGYIKQCLHPDHSKCSGNIIKAHSIQNNRILNKIGRNGEVYMVKSVMNRHSFRMKFRLIGRKVATTFTGFCGFHDKELFQPIEDLDYCGSEQQDFLFAYRVFSFEYHKKMEAQNTSRKRLDNKPSLVKNKRYLAYLEGYDLGISDNIRHKKIFDQALIDQNYGIVETVSFKLAGAARFAVCSGFFLEFDLKGKRVNQLSDLENRMKILMVNVFPQNNRTIVLFSWLKEDSNTYSEFREQLLRLDSKQKIQLLNNLIPAYCENVAYNPDYIDSWNDQEKFSYLEVFRQSIHNPVEKSKRNLLGSTNYSLFQSITND